jgi:hypothetical protein
MQTLRGVAQAVCAITLLCAACSPSDAGDGGGERVDEAGSQIIEVNGLQLNGYAYNGLQLNGERINGLQLNGMEKNGLQLNGVTLLGTEFFGIYDGSPIDGQGFTGVKIKAVLSDGSKIDLSVDSIQTSDEDNEINLFKVSYDNGVSGPVSLCGVDADGVQVPAIPLLGTWNEANGAHVENPLMFTFACRGYALAKCAEIGYKPWTAKPECAEGGIPCQLVPLSAVHQACTRLLTADYCGDGTAHTVNGTTVDLWDAIGIFPRSGLPGATFEAEWSPSGAVCVTATRLNNVAAEDYILEHCPWKWQTEDCGGDSSTFFTVNGYYTDLKHRALLRNDF